MSILARIKRALRIGSRLNDATANRLLHVDSTGTTIDQSDNFYFTGTQLRGVNDGVALTDETPSATNPVVLLRGSDDDTGVGSGAVDTLHLIAGGKEGWELQETTAGNDSLRHTFTGLLGQDTGDETAVSINYTTNKATSGNDYGLVINQTDTASPGVSYLLELRLGGAQRFAVTNYGGIFAFSDAQFPNNVGITSNANNSTLRIQGRNYTNADNAVEVMTGTFSNTSGTSSTIAILPTYNQTSGTGANTDLLVNRVETAVGSGEQNLLDLQVGSTSKFRVSNGGDLFFGSGAGLQFGEIYANDVADTITITGTGIANKVQVTSFAANGEANGAVPDHTNDHITVSETGKYLVTCSISCANDGGTAFKAGFSVFKNNGATEFENLHAHRILTGAAGDHGSLSISGIATLTANDTIEVWVWNESNTENVEIDDITLSIVQIGA